MRWKFVLVLVLLAGLVLAYTYKPGPSEQERTYWDTAKAPQVSVPLESEGKSFGIKVIEWKPDSFGGKVSLSVPVVNYTDLASCVIRGRSVHLSYFGGSEEYPFEESCQAKGKITITLPGQYVGEKEATTDATKVTCTFPVHEGVTYYNISCTDQAGQTAVTPEAKFIIDKMKPRILKDTISVENFKLGVKDTNLAPKVTFDVQDLNPSTCFITIPTFLKDENGAIINYSFLCEPSPKETYDFDELKTYTQTCTPMTLAMPLGFINFTSSKNVNITCTDNVGNTLTRTGEEIPELNVERYAQDLGDLDDIVYRACKFAWKDASVDELDKYGFYAMSGGSSPSKDDKGVFTLAYFRKESSKREYSASSLVDDANGKLTNDPSVRQWPRECYGGIAACAGLCALDIFTAGGDSAAKDGIINAIKSKVGGLLKWRPFKLLKGSKLAKAIGSGSFRMFKAGGSTRIEALSLVYGAAGGYSAWYLPLWFARAFGVPLASFAGWSELATNYPEKVPGFLAKTYYIKEDKAKTEHSNWLINGAFDVIRAVTMAIPCGPLVNSITETAAAPDYPDVILIYDSDIGGAKAGHSYLIHARIERIDFSKGWPPGAEQVGECLFGCPDYACMATIAPNHCEGSNPPQECKT